MKKLLSKASQADLANDTMQFERRYAEAGGSWLEKARALTRELFAADPHCGVCGREILDVNTAAPFEVQGRNSVLLCNDGACHVKAIIGRIPVRATA